MKKYFNREFLFWPIIILLAIGTGYNTTMGLIREHRIEIIELTFDIRHSAGIKIVKNLNEKLDAIIINQQEHNKFLRMLYSKQNVLDIKQDALEEHVKNGGKK